MPYKDRETRRKAERARKAKDPERFRAYAAMWRAANRDRIRDYDNTRNAMLRAGAATEIDAVTLTCIRGADPEATGPAKLYRCRECLEKRWVRGTPKEFPYLCARCRKRKEGK